MSLARKLLCGLLSIMFIQRIAISMLHSGNVDLCPRERGSRSGGLDALSVTVTERNVRMAAPVFCGITLMLALVLTQHFPMKTFQISDHHLSGTLRA
uniref:Secreted protein n=1 Tax=Rhipicephalus zambeziensis TaxID=60191 RepID=A0A224YHP2_9ACAR